MTVVFVHGVPETPAIWSGVRARIGVQSVALRLPGFGRERPERLRDKDGYADWLAAELRGIGGPVDLVGHDWGGHLAMRVVTAFDVPVRTWVSDVAYGWLPGYEWHPAAKVWQSGAGEASLAGIRQGTPGTFGELLQPRGMSPELAKEIDAGHDDTMDAAILALYRSAVPNLYADWGQQITGPTAVPGLVVIPAGDPMGDEAGDTEVARRLGARVERLEGLTHYWMQQDPDRAAEVLLRFWANPRG